MSATRVTGYSKNASEALLLSEQIADQNYHSEIQPIHLLAGILKVKGSNAYTALTRYVKESVLSNNLNKYLVPSPGRIKKPIVPSSDLKMILSKARTEAQNAGASIIDTSHLLIALSSFPHLSAGMVLNFYGLTNMVLMSALKDLAAEDSLPAQPKATAPAPSPVQAQTDAPKACGLGKGCGCSNYSDDKMKETKKTTEKTADSIRRDTWIAILDRALEMSANSGMTIPAAFIQCTFSSPQIVDEEVSQQIRIAHAEKIFELALTTTG